MKATIVFRIGTECGRLLPYDGDSLKLSQTGVPMVAPSLLREVTAVVKTFERPDALNVLIGSIRKYYPDLHIIVADDSIEPNPRRDVEYLRLEPDVGISAGRNALLKRVPTRYFLLLDDDFEFIADTRIERLVEIVAGDDVALAAGDCVRCRRKRYWWGSRVKRKLVPYHGIIERTGDELTLSRGYRSQEDGYSICEIVSNFFVARTADIRRIGGWDEDLKINEHEEFFLRFHEAGLRAAHRPDVTVLHWLVGSRRYSKYRNRDYLGLALRKHGINVFHDMYGHTNIYGSEDEFQAAQRDGEER
jgi:GT2 family glycosyltransferase